MHATPIEIWHKHLSSLAVCSATYPHDVTLLSAITGHVEPIVPLPRDRLVIDWQADMKQLGRERGGEILFFAKESF